MTEKKTNRQGRKNHMNTVVVLLAIVICLAVTGNAGYVTYTQSRPGDPLPQLEPKTYAQGGALNDPAGREAALDALIAEGMLTFSTNATLNMENEKSMASLMIRNPPDSGNRFTVAIIREDAGEGLFRSGYLDPEQYIEEVPLDMELEAGEHACVANLDTYRIQNNAYIERGVTRTTLYVKN